MLLEIETCRPPGPGGVIDLMTVPHITFAFLFLAHFHHLWCSDTMTVSQCFAHGHCAFSQCWLRPVTQGPCPSAALLVLATSRTSPRWWHWMCHWDQWRPTTWANGDISACSHDLLCEYLGVLCGEDLGKCCERGSCKSIGVKRLAISSRGLFRRFKHWSTTEHFDLGRIFTSLVHQIRWNKHV